MINPSVAEAQSYREYKQLWRLQIDSKERDGGDDGVKKCQKVNSD